MCELSVFLNGEIVCRDVIYTKAQGNNIVVKDILGVLKVFENCVISEVDISSERLTLKNIRE